MMSFPGCKQQRHAQGSAFSASRPVDPGEGWGLCPGSTAGSPSCLPAAWLLRLHSQATLLQPGHPTVRE